MRKGFLGVGALTECCSRPTCNRIPYPLEKGRSSGSNSESCVRCCLQVGFCPWSRSPGGTSATSTYEIFDDSRPSPHPTAARRARAPLTIRENWKEGRNGSTWGFRVHGQPQGWFVGRSGNLGAALDQIDAYNRWRCRPTGNPPSRLTLTLRRIGPARSQKRPLPNLLPAVFEPYTHEQLGVPHLLVHLRISG